MSSEAVIVERVETMTRTMRAGCLAVALTAASLGASTGFAQSSEEVRPVFEHQFPTWTGKSMVAVS